MSVIVKGMEMPETCLCCCICVDTHNGESVCNFTGDDIEQPETRNKNCPLVEIPSKHGRLIDKDRLKREMLWNFAGEKIPLYDCYNNPVDFHVKDVEATINSQPTVIEAEGE